MLSSLCIVLVCVFYFAACVCLAVYLVMSGQPYFCKKCGGLMVIIGWDYGMSPFDGICDPIYACSVCKAYL